MKMMLSIPRTISNAVKVPSAIHTSGFASQSSIDSSYVLGASFNNLVGKEDGATVLNLLILRNENIACRITIQPDCVDPDTAPREVFSNDLTTSTAPRQQIPSLLDPQISKIAGQWPHTSTFVSRGLFITY